MIKYYGNHDFPELASTGYRATRDGTHTVWAWIKTGHKATFAVGRAAVSTKASGHKEYVWAQLRMLSLKKKNLCRIKMSGATISSVPLIAVCSSPSDDPSKHHPLTHTHREHPDPMPDARAALTSNIHTPCTLKLDTYESLKAWESRALYIRKHILSTFGLLGGLPNTPLRPKVFGKIQRKGYSVEKVEFQSLPGFYCHGNLYRPSARGPHPGVLCPHGHCQNGRFEDSDKFFGSIPSRCINLARQGHVAFSYDMVGYNDSWQVQHRDFGGKLEDLWGIGVMGLQLINSSRALDFLQSVPEVDPERIGCTGASGGGTQTFMLTAIDDRVKVSAPVNMISAHMQGGCNCENQAGLRIDLNNIEIASTMAPRPMIMVSATGDWTVNTPEIEYPAVREIYRLYGAEDRLASAQVEADHNYNRESREHVYAWFGKWLLGIDDPQKFKEQPWETEPGPALRVMHRRTHPSNARSPEGVIAHIHSRSIRNGTQLRSSRAKTREALTWTLRADFNPIVSASNLGRVGTPECIIDHTVLSREGAGDRIPLIAISPRSRLRGSVILLQAGGKNNLFTSRGRPGALLKSLLAERFRVLSPDLFLTGESGCYNSRDQENHDRHFAAYNLTDAQCRIQDIITVGAYVAGLGGAIHLAALKGLGLEALFARPFLRKIKSTSIDISATHVERDSWWAENVFIPGIRNVGDVLAPTALTVPASLALFGTGAGIPVREIREQYRQRGATGNLTIAKTKLTLGLLTETLTQ